MRSDLWGDPHISRLCDITSSGQSAVIGALYWLWSTADQYADTSGMLHDLTLAGINRTTGVPGIAEALESIGWIDEHDSGILLVRFDEHCSDVAKKRAETAKRVAKHKINAVCVSDALADRYPDVSEALPEKQQVVSNMLEPRQNSVSNRPESRMTTLMSSQLDDA